MLELDDPLDPAFDLYLAGWKRALTVAPTSAFNISHPHAHLKSMAFEDDALEITDGGPYSTEQFYFAVENWEQGAVQPGSSGSPLFDQHKRVVGQLAAGGAGCGSDEPDFFVRWASSWTGGGTPKSRLSDWLDPAGTQALTLDGMEGEYPPVTVTAGGESLGVSWAAVAAADGYTVQWKAGAESYARSRQARVAATRHTISGLPAGTAVTVRVRAIRAAAADGHADGGGGRPAARVHNAVANAPSTTAAGR